MEMKIGRFSRFTGIPEQTLRYYEDMGLLHPERNPDNGYRVYTHKNLMELTQARMLRGLDIPVGKISSQSDVLALFDEQQQVIEKQIIALEQELARLRRLQLRYAEPPNEILQTSVCGMYRLMLSDPAVCRHPETPNIIREWLELMPYCHFTIIIPRADLCDASREVICPQWGIGIIQSYFEKLASPPPAPAVYYERFQSLSANVFLENPFRIRREELSAFDEYLQREGLSYKGDMYGVLNYYDSARDRCYMSLQTPVA